MASTYLTRTFSASPTSDKIITFSAWIKRSGSGEQHIFGNRATDSYRAHIYLMSDDRLCCFSKKTDGTNTTLYDLITTRKFRDLNGYYHIVVAIDTTQAASGDRVKIYVNGVQETAFDLETQPAQDSVLQLNKDLAHEIGSYDGTNYFFDGYMSHIIFIDGTQYAASSFGETDSTTGEWKILTTPTLTYGNHGFFILKNGNSVTDQSGNSNDWTVGAGTLTDMLDCPSDLFATLNPLNRNTNVIISNCNNTIFSDAGTGGTNYRQNISTLGMDKGKYYCEVKNVEVSAGTQFGVVDITQFTNDRYIGYTSRGYGYMNTGEYYNNGSSVTSGLTTFAGNIISIAFDADNSNVYFRVDGGSWENGGDPTSGSTGTGALAVTSGYTYAFGASAHGANPKQEFNFGNGYFGTSAIASEGTNASGEGKFEYDVPTGYTALSTKGINI